MRIRTLILEFKGLISSLNILVTMYCHSSIKSPRFSKSLIVKKIPTGDKNVIMSSLFLLNTGTPFTDSLVYQKWSAGANEELHRDFKTLSSTVFMSTSTADKVPDLRPVNPLDSVKYLSTVPFCKKGARFSYTSRVSVNSTIETLFRDLPSAGFFTSEDLASLSVCSIAWG